METRLKLAGHPIHPMLIVFPLGLFSAGFLFDVVYLLGRDAVFADVAFWTITVGIVGGLLAAVFGLIDFLGEPRIRALNDARWHAGGNVPLYNWYTRYTTGEAAILPTGLTLSLIVVCILLFTGWKGWNLVYRYRVAVADR